jgi:mono/diheme cytochrome c family protein
MTMARRIIAHKVFELAEALLIGAVVSGAGSMAQAQQSGSAEQNVRAAPLEYAQNCAGCHGLFAKGQELEPFWIVVGTTTPNLTVLSKRNAGVFPFERVYETIDGRQEAQGQRVMPIWGHVFRIMSSKIDENGTDYVPYNNSEEFAHARILALTEYIKQLQAD